MNLVEKIAFELKRKDKKRYITTYGESLSSLKSVDVNADLAKKIYGVMEWLKEHSQPGDKILIITSPGVQFVADFIACILSGRIAIPCYPPLGIEAIRRFKHIIEEAEVKIILYDKKIKQLILGLRIFSAGLKIPLIRQFVEKFSSHTFDAKAIRSNSVKFANTSRMISHNTAVHAKVRPQDTAVIQYSSGTTAKPKGCLISYENIEKNLAFCHQLISQDATPLNVVSWLPPYHDMGLICTIYPLWMGTNLHIASPDVFMKNPEIWFYMISHAKECVSPAPNFAYSICLKKISTLEQKQYNLSKWKSAICGGEPIQLQTLDEFIHKFGVLGFLPEAMSPCYGMAEATLIVSGRRGLKSRNRIVDCGAPFLKVVIYDFKNDHIASDGEIGEICIAGSSVFSGYYKKDNDKYFADINGQLFFRTGDLGFKEEGHLYVSGRSKEILIVAGKNFSPHVVEKTIADHVPLLRPGCAIVYQHSEQQSNHINVIAELRDPNLSTHRLNSAADNISGAVNQEFGVSVHRVTFLPPRTIPKTTSGKLKRSQVQTLIDDLPKIFDRRESHETYGSTDTEKMLAVVRPFINVDIDDSALLKAKIQDLGIESLAIITLSESIERNFSGRIDLEKIEGSIYSHSVQDIIDLISTD